MFQRLCQKLRETGSLITRTSLVYRERPTTRDDMIHRISEAIRSLGDDEILRATNSFQNRIDTCIAANGAHFEYFV
ncbi:hypothetical protein X777_04745 [Ooceraea biroi]|uniref:Uncharacterized protein n=1 Tax=Ooceraea biroi TaxID=2015173 RepID=A0A026WK32_OOCBI|nr:hypothetical protein X777_04745 [Ooceraea biroi]